MTSADSVHDLREASRGGQGRPNCWDAGPMLHTEYISLERKQGVLGEPASIYFSLASAFTRRSLDADGRRSKNPREISYPASCKKTLARHPWLIVVLCIHKLSPALMHFLA